MDIKATKRIAVGNAVFNKGDTIRNVNDLEAKALIGQGFAKEHKTPEKPAAPEKDKQGKDKGAAPENK